MNTHHPQPARMPGVRHQSFYHPLAILLATFALILANNSKLFAQTGTIEIKLVDSVQNAPAVSAAVQIIETRQGAITKDSGIAFIRHVKPGTYRVKIRYANSPDIVLHNVIVKANDTTRIESNLHTARQTLVIADSGRMSKFAISEIEVADKSAANNGNYAGGVSGGVLAPSSGDARGGVLAPSNESYNYNAPRGISHALKLGGYRGRQPAAQHPYNQYYQSGRPNTEQYDRIDENPYLSVSQNPLSTFSIDVDVASYANIRRMLMESQTPPPDAVRIEEMINYFSYDYPQPEGKTPFSVTTELSTCPWDANHQLLQIGLQGKEIAKEKLPPSNLVFLIDVSGSMDVPNKLPLLQRAFRLLVNELRAQDRVAIVVYAGNAGLVLPSTPGDQKEKIMATIDKLEAGGSTNGGEGILLAYKIAKENFMPEGNNRVILATDGDFNVGISGEGDLVRMMEEKRKEGVYISLLAVGEENLKDSQMEKIADKGNGNYAYIDNILEAQKVLVTQMGGTLYTIAKDVKLQLEFNPAEVKGYRLIGYEDRLLAKEDFNNDQKDAGELGSGHSVTALYELIPAGSSEVIPNGSVDPLKYQTIDPTLTQHATNEMLTIKLRYKDPKDTVSKLVEHVVSKQAAEQLANASENLRFSAAVAGFGMLLRHSDYKGDATIQSITELAEGARGKDKEGYRVEFIKLLKLYNVIDEDKASK